MSVSDEFFADLAQRGHDPRLHRANGSVLFELTRTGGTDRWRVGMALGDVTVSSGRDADTDGGAGCVVRGTGSLFDEIVSGRANAMAAMLRGELVPEGDLELLYEFQRVFPGPPGALHPRERLASKGNAS